MNYLDLFAERLTTPLGMTSTQFVLASDTNPRIAGGIESTVADYSRFMDMLANDGQSDGADFLEWQRGFTLPAANAALSLANATSVPEPDALVIVSCAALCLVATRRRH